MRFKLDENFDLRLGPLLAEGGHDVQTVLSEGLSGQADESIYQACLRERRTLITLDMDFSNPLRFPPRPTQGIAVIRPHRPALRQLQAVLTRALPLLKNGQLAGRLWIVEPGRVREFQPDDETAGD